MANKKSKPMERLLRKSHHASLIVEELDDTVYSNRLSILFDNKIGIP